MATRTYCDRPSCGKEITETAYRLVLPLKKEKDLCKECSGELVTWLNKEPEKE